MSASNAIIIITISNAFPKTLHPHNTVSPDLYPMYSNEKTNTLSSVAGGQQTHNKARDT